MRGRRKRRRKRMTGNHWHRYFFSSLLWIERQGFSFFNLKGGLMYRLKSHLWPACTTCYLHKTLKSFVKYVRGRGGEAPGGAPGGRCPKCRTVTHGLHFETRVWTALQTLQRRRECQKWATGPGRVPPDGMTLPGGERSAIVYWGSSTLDPAQCLQRPIGG